MFDLLFYKNKREFKGKSLLNCTDDFTIIDITTTGYDFEFDSIIEIAAIKYRNCLEIDRFYTLVKVYDALDPFIIERTGITDEMLKDAPEIDQILEPLKNFVGNDIIISHNANFVINFLYDSFMYCRKYALSNDFIDTLRLSRNLYKDFENHKLSTLAKNFNINQEVSHRALYDCITILNCYLYMKEYIKINNLDLSKRKHGNQIRAKELSATNHEFDENHCLFKKYFAFTGALEKMIRKEAMQLVLNIGGYVEDGVTKKTNYLVLGNFDYSSSVKNGKSSKQIKAENLIKKGQDLRIISENVFYDLIADSSKED